MRPPFWNLKEFLEKDSYTVYTHRIGSLRFPPKQGTGVCRYRLTQPKIASCEDVTTPVSWVNQAWSLLGSNFLFGFGAQLKLTMLDLDQGLSTTQLGLEHRFKTLYQPLNLFLSTNLDYRPTGCTIGLYQYRGPLFGFACVFCVCFPGLPQGRPEDAVPNLPLDAGQASFEPLGLTLAIPKPQREASDGNLAVAFGFPRCFFLVSRESKRNACWICLETNGKQGDQPSKPTQTRIDRAHSHISPFARQPAVDGKGTLGEIPR